MLQSCHLCLFADNQPAIYMLRKHSTKSTVCFPVVKSILQLLYSNGITLDTSYVPSKSNIADPGSRRIIRNSYSLPSAVVSTLLTRHNIDLHVFATGISNVCSAFAALD